MLQCGIGFALNLAMPRFAMPRFALISQDVIS